MSGTGEQEASHSSVADPRVHGVLALTTALLAASAVMLVTGAHVSAAYLAARGAGRHFSLAGAMRPIDASLLVAATASGLSVIAVELRNRAISRLLSAAPLWMHVILVLAVTLLAGHAILLPGLLVVGDSGAHVARISHLVRAWRTGQSLYWDNMFFGGGLLLQNTGPVFHWAAAAISLVTNDATRATKLLAFVLRALAGIGMLLFLRRAGLRREAALLGALFLAAGFPITYFLSIRGKFPQILQIAAFVYVLLCLEEIWRSRRRFGLPFAGLCLAAIVLVGNHQPTALMGVPLLAIFLLCRFGARAIAVRLPVLAAAAAAILIGAIGFLLPFARERGWGAEATSTDSLIGLAWPHWDIVRLYMIWGAGGTGPASSVFLGIVPLTLALAGAWLGRSPAPAARLWRGAAAAALLSLVLTGAQVRPAVYTAVFLPIAAAAAVDLVVERWAARTGWLPVALLAAFALESLPLAIQPFNRPDMARLLGAGEALAERAAGQRVLEVNADWKGGPVGVSVGPDSTVLDYANVAMLRGPHKLDATKAHNAAVAALELAQTDLRRTGRLSPDTALILAQYDVGWIAGSHGAEAGLPPGLVAGAIDPAFGSYARISGATPVLGCASGVVTPRPAAFDAPPFWQKSFDVRLPAALQAEAALPGLIRNMGIDLAARTCSAVLLTAPLAGSGWPPQGIAPHIRDVAYQLSQGEAKLDLTSDAAGLLRIAHPVFPGLEVLRNRLPVPIAADVMSMLVVPVMQGRNDYMIAVHPSTLRIASLFISLASIIFLTVLLLAGAARRLAPHNGRIFT